MQSDEKSDGASEALWFLEVSITKSERDFEIISGRFVVDAKSIMDIFILDQVHIFNILSDLLDIRRSQALAFLLRC